MVEWQNLTEMEDREYFKFLITKLRQRTGLLDHKSFRTHCVKCEQRLATMGSVH
jgi:hypothetical protein